MVVGKSAPRRMIMRKALGAGMSPDRQAHPDRVEACGMSSALMQAAALSLLSGRSTEGK